MEEEKKAVIGGNSFVDGQSFDFESIVAEDPTSPDCFDVRGLQLAALGRLLNAMPIPALLIDPLSRIAFANPPCSRINLRPDKIQGLSLSTLFPDESAFRQIQRLTEEILATGKSQVIDTPVEITEQRLSSRLYLQSMRLGTNKWMVLLVEDLSNEKTQLLSRHRYDYEFQKEIIDQGRAEKLLFDNQQWQELALRGAGLGLWDLDLEKDKGFVNQMWAEIFGYLPDEIEASMSFWLNLIHPDDSLQFLKAWDKHLEGFTGRFEAEHRIRSKAGEWKWVQAWGKIVERARDGKPLRISGAVHDVTDRKRSEQKLFQVPNVFMDAIDPIFIRDLEGNVVDLNRAAEQTYGWSRGELIGKSMKTIVPADLHARAEELHERCKRGERVENVEATHVTKSGVIIPVLLSLSLLTNERAEPVGIATIIKSLRALKLTEEMLSAQTKALERSNKDLEEFAYVAAHDLREPLIGIAAHIKLLERHLKHRLDAEAHKFISRALDTITRMDSLIQSLLGHSRLVSEAKHLEPTDCNVAVRDAMVGLRSAMKERVTTVEIEPLPTVMANPSLLVQVFHNLVSNAIRFAGDEPLKICIGARREKSEWMFFVRDNGIGIEPPYFERIFNIFQRIDSSSSRPGTGIGLANCKKIVEHHGGRIWVASEPGKGSTFFFTVPYRMASDD